MRWHRLSNAFHMEGKDLFILHSQCHGCISRHGTGLVIPEYSGAWFIIKMTSYQYKKSHCGDKTVVRSSYLHNGISYTGKMSSLYWIRPLVSAPQGFILTHLPLDKMAANLADDFSNEFSWMKMIELWFKFHWNLFLWVQLTIGQHWFR